MAVALESFSIREFVGKMRSVDFGKCWPFDGDGKKGDIERSLPTISFRKFRWWSDELEIGRSRSLDESTVEIPALEPQAKTPPKAKQRTPKKRSIVELFAVAPQIETVEEEDDGDEGEEEPIVKDGQQEKGGGGEVDGGGGLDRVVSEAPRRRKERVKDEKKEMMRKKVRMQYKIKKKKKQRQVKVETYESKEEKIHKPKMSYLIDTSHLPQDSVCKKQLGKTLRVPVDNQKKKPPTLKSLTSRRNFKDVKTLKLISEKQEVSKVFPVHGILKNQTRATSTKKKSVIGDAHGDNIIKSCRALVKHVTFSGKDDILGHNKNSSSLELPQLQTLRKIFSDVLAASSATDDSRKVEKLSPATEGAQFVSDSDKDVVAGVTEKTDWSSSEKKQLSDAYSHTTTSVNLSNGNCTGTEKTCLGETVDLNSAVQVYSDLNCSSSYSGTPQILNPTYEEGLNFNGGIHAEKSIFRTSIARSFPIPTGGCVSSSDPTCSLTITRNVISQPSTSCLATSMQANERQSHLSVESKFDFFSCIPEFQRKCHFSPKDISSICSSTGFKTFGESRLASDPMTISREKCIGEDFIGLPLNSQGEVISLHSTGKFGFSDLFKKQNTRVGSLHNFPLPNPAEPKCNKDLGKMKGKFPGTPLCQKDRLKWFPEQYYPASRPVTSGLGITELQSFERREVQSHELMKDQNQFISRNHNPVKVSTYGCRDHNQTHNWTDREKFQAEGNLDLGIQPATQPTMRLMGKNVTVGKRSNECQGFCDGRMWTDKEIVTEQCSLERVSDKPHPERWPQQEWVAHSASGTSKGNFLQPLDAPASLYFPEIRTRFHCIPFDCQQQWMPSNALSSTIGNHGSKVHNSSHPLHHQGSLNKTSESIFNCNSATESVEMGHQIPAVASHPQNVCQRMLQSSTYCKHNQSLSYTTTSTSHPPFANHNHGNFVGPLCAHSSSYLPQWLLNVKEQRKNQNASCPYSDPIARHQPCKMSGTNLPPFPSPYPTPIFSFPIYNTNALGSSNPAPLAHPSIIPAYPASNSASTANSTYRNKTKNRNGKNSKFTHAAGLDNVNKSKKRSSDRSDGFVRPLKKPNSIVYGDSNAPIEPRRRERLHGCIPYNTGTLEMLGNGYKRMDKNLPVFNNEKDGFRTSSRSSSPKFDSGLRSGPVRLSAGAKHILKPSQNTGVDNSRPIHSTVPFGSGTGYGKVPVSLKKATKIYRF